MKRTTIISIILILSGFFTFQIQSQEIGKYFIRNYTNKEYAASTQNWSVIQDQRGIMYFANTFGVLEYDGENWRKIDIGVNSASCIDLHIDHFGNIIVGSINDLGFLAPDSLGSMKFHSLKNKVPEKHRELGTVWMIESDEKNIYFLTTKGLLVYNYKAIKYYKAAMGGRMCSVNGRIYFRDTHRGLLEVQQDTLVPVFENSLLPATMLFAFTSYKENKFIAATASNGVKIININTHQTEELPASMEEIDHFLKGNRAYHSIKNPDGSISFTTFNKGAIIAKPDGQVTDYINTDSGLQFDQCLYAGMDREQNLWLALGNGISYVETNTPITYFDKSKGLEGTVHDMERYNDTFYAVTSTGLYELKNGSFERSPLVKTQAWQLKKIKPNWAKDSLLLIGTSNSLVTIDKNNKHKDWGNNFSNNKVVQTFGNYIFCGGIDGIMIVENTRKGLKTRGRISVFKDMVTRIFPTSENEVWVQTRSDGIYKLSWLAKEVIDKPHIVKYDTLKGLPAMAYNKLFFDRDKIFIATEESFYSYDTLTDTFKEDHYFNDFYKNNDSGIWLIRKAPDGNFWAATHEDKVYKLYTNGQVDSTLFKRLPREGVYSFYFDKDSITWIGTTDGLYRYDTKRKFYQSKKYNTNIRSVYALQSNVNHDSILFNGAYKDKVLETKNPLINSFSKDMSFAENEISLPYSFNGIKIAYAAAWYTYNDSVYYSYQLEGLDENWSDWETREEKDFINLWEGNYSFKVKAKNIFGVESEIALYNFQILPPWYRTYWAYAAYMFLGLVLIAAIVKLRTWQLKKEKEHLEEIVKKRTSELLLKTNELEQQKEEILTQRDTIEGHYQELDLQREEIEAQAENLQKANDSILQQNKKIKTLLRELHHRVKNNLQIVSDLLELQSVKLTDENARQAVMEGQQRVHAMTLIHSELYSNEEVTYINMPLYVQNLVSGLLHTYGYQEETFQLDINISEIEMHVNTAIPVGLIINELATNAFKYAFPEIRRPALFIDILIDKEKEILKIVLKDNGAGLPTDFDWKYSNSFGLKLIQTLLKQLKGEMKVYNNEGACYELMIYNFQTKG